MYEVFRRSLGQQRGEHNQVSCFFINATAETQREGGWGRGGDGWGRGGGTERTEEWCEGKGRGRVKSGVQKRGMKIWECTVQCTVIMMISWAFKSPPLCSVQAVRSGSRSVENKQAFLPPVLFCLRMSGHSYRKEKKNHTKEEWGQILRLLNHDHNHWFQTITTPPPQKKQTTTSPAEQHSRDVWGGLI